MFTKRLLWLLVIKGCLFWPFFRREATLRVAYVMVAVFIDSGRANSVSTGLTDAKVTQTAARAEGRRSV